MPHFPNTMQIKLEEEKKSWTHVPVVDIRHIILIANQPVFAHDVCSLEKQQIPVYSLWFDPTRLEPMMYYIRGEHVSQYANDVVCTPAVMPVSTNTCTLHYEFLVIEQFFAKPSIVVHFRFIFGKILRPHFSET